MTTSQKQILEFNYDISCPFAYIASTRVEALATRTKTHLVWSPVLLGAIYRQTAAPQGAAGSASDVFNAAKKAVSSDAINRTLTRYKIPFHQPKKHPNKTTSAIRLIYSLPNEQRPALTKALFRAYWVDDKDVSDPAVLKEIASQCGISDIKIDSPALRESLEKATLSAVARGAPGVPAFWIPAETWTDSQGKTHQGRLYWGQDRMHFVEAVLIALKKSIIYQQVPDLAGLQPRCLHHSNPTKPTKLEFYYDFSSPWAFLGWTQLSRMKREAGANLEIELKPILLGALFREIGSPMMPVLAMSPQKRAYSNKDQNDWIRHRNALNAQTGNLDEEVTLRFPDQFPIRTPTLLRVAMVEPRTIPVMYRACWSQNLNVSDPSVLASLLTSAGFNAADLLEKASKQGIKDQLRANTDEAKRLGLCGVPTYRVLEKDGSEWTPVGGLVWGQDELGVVMDLIAGWREGEGGVADVSAAHREGGKNVSRL